MMKKIYILAWILLAASFLGAWQHENLNNPLVVLAFSFTAFGLFYGFALWLTFTNDPKEAEINGQIGKINNYRR